MYLQHFNKNNNNIWPYGIENYSQSAMFGGVAPLALPSSPSTTQRTRQGQLDIPPKAIHPTLFSLSILLLHFLVSSLPLGLNLILLLVYVNKGARVNIK